MTTSQEKPPSPQLLSADLKQSLYDLINTDLVLTSELLKTLQLEREALKQREFDSVVAIVESKTQLLDQLDSNSRQRQSLLHQAGFTGNQRQIKQVIEQLNDKNLQRDWNKLLDVVKQCKHENAVNGKMVARGRQTLGHLLNLLRGQVGTPQLYDESGSTTNSKSSNSCIKV
jgi:flagella synthesis protein FlgN